MKISTSLWIAFLFACALTQPAYALNFGGSTSTTQSKEESPSQSSPVEVTNLPIQVLTKKINNEDKEIPYVRVMDADYFIQEIGKEITLGNSETYESDPLDVREYKEVAFYVVPDQMMGDQAEAVYQLDAFFSITSSAQKVQKMGEKTKSISKGWQEFGSMDVDDKNKELQSSFHKLTTGETSTRVLTTKVHGPFVRVVLKNLTPESKRKFQIVAYLTR